MDNPLPRQRSGEVKKPIPTPRKSILQKIPEPNLPEENTNILSKKVSSISSASKQLAGDFGSLVNDRRRAVIEGTRQSVRRLTRRFSSSSQENNNSEEVKAEKNDQDALNIFSSIRFNSPISQTENIYNNVNEDDVSTSSEDDLVGMPPPSHPPPPPPDESLYDAPASTTSSTSEISTSAKPSSAAYESVFPPYPLQKDSNSSSEKFESLSTSGSWKFYDAVSSKNENVYNNVEEKDSLNEGKNVNSNASDNSTVIFRNSLYENHEISLQSPPPRVSKSVILQFDPLNHNETNESKPTQENQIRMLEEMLQGDLYGNISDARTLDEWSLSNDSEPDEFISPPTPPMRMDSLPEEEQEDNVKCSRKLSFKSRTNWFTTESSTQKQTCAENKKHSWFKQVKEVLEKAPDVVRGVKNKENMLDRPAIGMKTIVQNKGMLFKVQNGPVEDLFGEYSGRWCIIENANFYCYSDNTCQNLKEHFLAQNILSIQILQDKKYNYRYDNDDLYCFELNTAGKSRGGHIYGSRNISERRVWLQLLAESLTSRFSAKLTTNFTRIGWAYVREGVSGKWVGAWLILSERELHYAIDNYSVKKMDLRKARCIQLQPYQDTDNNPRTNDRGPNMIIDCPDVVLHLRMWTSRETKVWCHIVKLAAHNNGANLDQQQLTKEDVPVIVKKCIDFIYIHGSMTEGIYRRPGTGSLVADLLSKFRKDAFAVQLTKDQYNDHEVASALKRFFRDLPEPLLGSSQRQYLHEVSKHNNKEERIRMYRAALDLLPSISYNTARILFNHLHFVSSQSSKNLMTVDNLAAIWGPTLLHYEDAEGNNAGQDYHHSDAEVVAQITALFRHIFPEDPGEMEREKLMLKVLESHAQQVHGGVKKKTAGDLRIWIFLRCKEGKSFNVSIEPTKTAYEVCKELSRHIGLSVHELILEEVVLDDKLVRPIHHEEKILEVVLKWSYWDEQDRKHNYLLLSPLSKYWEYIIDKPCPVSGEIKFADNKSRVFRQYTFQFSQGKLTCFKDKTGEITLHSWNIEDVIMYLGHEGKRNPPTRWTVTFIEVKSHPVRSKSCTYFGNVLVWNDAASRANWLSAMLKARYPNNLAPPPNLLPL